MLATHKNLENMLMKGILNYRSFVHSLETLPHLLSSTHHDHEFTSLTLEIDVYTS